MPVSRFDLNSIGINDNSYSKEWKDKVTEKVTESLMSNEEVPSESLVIHWASELVFDYHNNVNMGRLSADNRNPNDEDIDLFVRIVMAILSKYDIIGEFSNFDDQYKRIYDDLMKRVVDSDKFEKRD